jgi:hypothetical protein
VTDVFAEVRLPIFLDRDFTRELTLDAAVRQADYSTSGKANTWKVGVTVGADRRYPFPRYGIGGGSCAKHL